MGTGQEVPSKALTAKRLHMGVGGGGMYYTTAYCTIIIEEELLKQYEFEILKF